MAERDFLGVGWQFPVGVFRGPDDVVRIGVSAYERAVLESIHILLGTARGERLMRPDFGCDLNRLTFAANNTSTAGLAMFYVRESLEKYEPRIELLAVDANPDAQVAQRLLIDIEYRILATDTTHNLVYPFYLARA
ncbi:MAG: GPW/gp25 family protein [Candidatus Accumulibacter sp. UW20]|jgi:phage baseplate assembly protein W